MGAAPGAAQERFWETVTVLQVNRALVNFDELPQARRRGRLHRSPPTKIRLPADTFAELQAETLRVAKTKSRRTLGHMTQMTFEIEHITAQARDFEHADIADLNHWLRHSLRHHRGTYVHPIDLVRQRPATRP